MEILPRLFRIIALAAVPLCATYCRRASQVPAATSPENSPAAEALKPPSTPAGFSLIPAGSFTMGRTSGDTDKNAPAPVTVHVSVFYMARHEVSKELWDEVRTWGLANGYADLPVGGGKEYNHPVQLVSWCDVVKWCNARSQKEGLTPCYTSAGAIHKMKNMTDIVCDWTANGYRLPTEAEWEKAARGGVSGLRFPWGDTIDHNHANYRSDGSVYSYDTSMTFGYNPAYVDDATPYTSPVGSFARNGYGLYDMAGNVLELCWDWFSETTYTEGASDPRGPASGLVRVVRGGSWSYYANLCRTAFSGSYIPEFSNYSIGFRLARSSVP